ncbi:ABC transporter ATP-binding protein [Curvivirga aplysinae]|uniref:ABC transporter ATP-binding protein n=1 Tax=Curvivirga aplysinae TaxID=2529852 RepID=UPI0012BCAF55|nr:ABC transporter ATP-binding protein [Curvivirga aplysinae]MTI11360.1 ABC transporter ATP-binding protein [Curvivirga aplysinae]
MGSSAISKGAAIPTPEYAINIKGLTKKYKPQGKAPGKLALDNVDLAIPRGSLFGLLGPNGAGKSTMINIMAGLVLKTTGSVEIWGTDIDEHPRNAKASIGIVPQELNIDPFFTPEELMNIHAGMYGVRKKDRRTEEILKSVGLWDKRDAYARTLSGGMRRRMLIGKAMVHNPPILVLDEPTAGVDIELRQQLWENVVELNKRGTTILLTTHYLEEAEELCDEIAIINHGTVVAHDDKKKLLGRLDAKTLKLSVREDLSEAPEALAKFKPSLKKESDGLTYITISYKPSEVTAGDIITATTGASLSIVDVSTEETDLEDIFLQLTSQAAA